METLRRQYFALLPPRLITLPSAPILSSLNGQAFLVDRLLQLSDNSALPEAEGEPSMSRTRLKEPESGYKRLFWRKVVQGVEDGLGEVDEEEQVSLCVCARH